MTERSAMNVAGSSILVVEDESVLADDIARALERGGATVIGPVSTVDRALALVRSTGRLDGAVLNIRLRGEEAFPVADALQERGVPFVFATGYAALVPERYGHIRRCEKPEPESVVRAVIHALRRNQLLTSLSADDHALLQPDLHHCLIRAGEALVGTGELIRYVYFPVSGIISAVAEPAGGVSIEVGFIGREGLAGLPVLLGADRAPYTLACQVAGEAWRLPAERLRRAMRESETLQTKLLRYAHAFMMQLAATAVANARFTIEQRLARWLLMTHDRLEGDELPLTHELIAKMLGVRRAGVTVATQVLEGTKAIRAERGRITVLDRRLLENLAGASYGSSEAELERIL